MNASNNILYFRYVTNGINSYSVGKVALSHYNQVSFYTTSNLTQHYVLYPLLMGLIKHKVIVLIILACI